MLCITPSPRQSPKENKLKLRPKIYVLQCTLYARKNVHLGFNKIYHRGSKTILNSTLPPTLQAAPREGWPALYQEQAVFGKMKMDPSKRAQTQNAGEV